MATAKTRSELVCPLPERRCSNPSCRRKYKPKCRHQRFCREECSRDNRYAQFRKKSEPIAASVAGAMPIGRKLPGALVDRWFELAGRL